MNGPSSIIEPLLSRKQPIMQLSISFLSTLLVCSQLVSGKKPLRKRHHLEPRGLGSVIKDIKLMMPLTFPVGKEAGKGLGKVQGTSIAQLKREAKNRKIKTAALIAGGALVGGGAIVGVAGQAATAGANGGTKATDNNTNTVIPANGNQ